MVLIDREPLLKKWGNGCGCEDDCHGDCSECAFPGAVDDVKTAPTIEAVPVQFIHEVIEYLTKCRDNAVHEETQTAWDEQRQTLIMLLHEWDAWNECGRTGKYGERREE